ncbi:MAG: serine/threonine protein kinase [Gemmataceae bacterium]|nr:serine/threonine protein kinase [Gemmataceae bacterium]
MPPTCPARTKLLAFHLGQLDEPELDQLGDHLTTCQACEATLDELATATDPLTAVLAMPRPEFAIDAVASVPGYTLLGVAGRGAMGVVHKAIQIGLDRTVAVKMVVGGAFAEPAAKARLRREATAIARLRHPNIVQVHEVGEHAGLPFVALEWVSGGTLESAIAGRPLPPREAARLVEAVARGAHHAHEHGLIHRDLKPANILLESGSPTVPKIVDFGLARHPDDGQLTATGALAGTPNYMAPEQTDSTATLGPATDIYSLGAILYESLTGRPPFRGMSAIDTLTRLKNDVPVPPRRVDPTLPVDLQTICMKCLEKKTERRYTTAAALADDLQRFLDGRPVSARPASWSRTLWLWMRRRPVLAASLATLQAALIIITIGATYFSKQLAASLEKTRRAEVRSAADARTAMDALTTLVTDVQKTLRTNPATRPLQKKLLETAIDGLGKVAATDDAGTPQPIRAAAYYQMALVHGHLGQSDQCREACSKARDAADAVLANQPADTDSRFHWADATRLLAFRHLTAGEADTARNIYGELIARAVPWCDEPKCDGQLAWTLILGYEGRGHAAQWGHHFDDAAIDFNEMLNRSQRWAEREPAAMSPPAGVARATHLLGTLARDRKQHSEATRYFTESLAAHRELLRRKPNVDIYIRGITTNLNDLASLAKLRGDLLAARTAVCESLTLVRGQVASDPRPENRLALADALVLAGEIEVAAKSWLEAIEFLTESQTILLELDRSGGLAAQPVYKHERLPAISAMLQRCKKTNTEQPKE